MSTYAEVELKVTVKLSQPWSDEESAEVVRNRAIIQARGALKKALYNTDIEIDHQSMVLIYSKTKD